MKNKKISIILAVLLIIATIATLFALSSTTNAEIRDEWSESISFETFLRKVKMVRRTYNEKNGKYEDQYAENPQAGTFAKYIGWYPKEFINLNPEHIFKLNEKKLKFGYGSAGDAMGVDTIASYFVGAMCVYENASNVVSKVTPNIVNVIDIETPGKITVYDENNKKEQIILTDKTDKENVTAFTYLLHKSSKYRIPFLKEDKGYNYNKVDNYDWKNPTFDVDLNNVNQSDLRSDSRNNDYGNQYKNINPLLNTKATISKMFVNDVNANSDTKNNGINSILSKSELVRPLMDEVFAGAISTGLNQGIIYDTQYLEEAQRVAREYGTDRKAEKVVTSNISAQCVGDKVYIGPLAVDYVRGTSKISIDEVDSSKILGWSKKEGSAFGEILTDSVPSCNEEINTFFVVVKADAVENLQSVKINLTLEWETYRGRVVLINPPAGVGQNLMFYAAIEDTDSEKIEWTVPLAQDKEITIQKQGANGPLAVEGIKFYVYKNGKYERTLTTKANGETDTFKIKKDEEYTIKEVQNSAYGYKGCTITNATIAKGKGNISVSNGEVKVKVTEDSIIEIKNDPQLGDLTIEKEGKDNKTKLEGVEFVLWKGNGYLKLNDESVNTPIDTTVDMTKYEETLVTEKGKATRFKTNADGKIVIKNLEIYSSKGKKYNYWLQEVSNNNYGYKAMKITDEGVTVEGGDKIEVKPSTSGVKFNIGDNTTEIKVTIKNSQELSNIKIQKEGKDENTKLEDVEFIIQRGENEYLQLKDSNKKNVSSAKGILTINLNNQATSNEYSATYVSNKNEATKFKTNKDGIVQINNIEINNTSKSKYTYTACEISNPNYGYGSVANKSLSAKVAKLELNGTTTIKINNEVDLGNLELEKYDDDNTNIKLENVGFVIETNPAQQKTYAYLALLDKNGSIVSDVKGTVTINSKNKATEDGKEYKVSYYYTDTLFSKMTENEKAKITTFKTGKDGKLRVNNLEVYETTTGNKYKYKLIETTNSNYGFEANSVELGNIELESNKTTEKQLGNSQKYTQISGYVWIENSTEEKANEYDGVYTEGNSSKDVKLIDLYVVKDGKLVKNEEATTKVEVKLRNKKTGEFVKTLPDAFDTKTGEYAFVGVEIEKLSDYEVVFVYNGFYYTTIVEKLSQANGSKVKEVLTERETLNSKFATVKDNSEVISLDKTVNKVQYQKDGHISTVVGFSFDTNVTATTSETKYDLNEQYKALKSNATGPVKALENINMGIVLREQPKISINNDIYSAQVELEGYKYNYKYNGRQNYYENKNDDDIGVKFEQENTTQRYTRTVYASDVQAAAEQGKDIKVSITYKLQIANESKTLSVMPKQIINYFDARYDIKAVGLKLDEKTHTITEPVNYSEPQQVEGNSSYKSIVIDFNQTITAANSNVKDLYITFDVQREAILDLLNKKSTYHNASEILSYASYYSENTLREINNIKDYPVYAGIDKMSQPGNMELKLIDHPSGDGTQILDTNGFEDDTASAPSLILEATEQRKISGIIWEDSATNTADNQKLGDGIYKQGEKLMQGVKVTLHNVKADGSVGEIATYSNGVQATTVTNEKGEYTLGYYDAENKKHAGILPGKYVIKYTYNNGTYIVGSKNINANEYKSTIITSQVVKDAFENTNEKWYLVEESNRYSDARDDLSIRPEYKKDIDSNITVTNSTYNTILKIESMDAYTPKMDIGIEFTQNNEADGTLTLNKEFKNIDFGIVERPNVDITIKKQITSLEIVAQNGTVIIPKGNPSNPGEEMQYVRTGLPGLVPAEIESSLLQGAQLSLEYTITVKNNSDKDYIEESYYYYGTGGRTESTTRVKKVVDYLDGTMSLDPNQSQDIWKQTTAEEIYNGGNGYISQEVYKELKAGKYHILTTDVFEEVGAASEKSEKLYATKYLAISDSIAESNKVEIIELTGKRTIHESEPGNNPPNVPPKEPDEDKIDLIITPPTGTTVDYTLYIIAGVITFIILVSGIVIIKKKIIK